jgi:flagellar hook-length control protein FliK
MRLDPPELGGVTIDARLDGTRLTVHIRAEHGATQEMLADALPRLRESLTQQGFVTDQINVQLSFDATGGGAFRDGTARDDGRPFAAPAPASPPPAPPRPARATVPTFGRAAHGGLDVWA